jgi:NADPH:quinone reductase-like Zn-dependent oxidoreductase
VRGAVMDRIGGPPSVKDVEEPVRSGGQALIQVAAAAINPLDLAIASGRYYGGQPEVPYVPGTEGVGIVVEAESIAAGTHVRFEARSGNGSLAERALATEDALIELPEGTDDDLAAAIGVAGLAAWLALEWRGKLEEGETVLVLGASGAVGQIAVQAARHLGAGRVIAAARSADGLRRARELGADATVELRGQSVDELSDQFREAAGSELDLVIDPLWGEPAVAALQTLRMEGRLVNLGQSAGSEAIISSASVRSRMRSILGHANRMTPPGVRRDAYLTLLEEASAGRLRVDFEVLPLDEIARAWEQQADSPHRKIVVRP